MDTKWLFFRYDADGNNYIKVETVDISSNNPDTEMFYYGNTLPNIGATNFSLSADNNGSLITSGINISTISGSTYYFGVRNKNNGNYEWGIKFNDVQYFPITETASASYNPMVTGNIVKDYLNVTNNWIFFKYDAPISDQNYIETVDISGNNPNTYLRYFGTQTPSSNMGNWVRNNDDKSTILKTSAMLFTATSGSVHYFAVSNITGINTNWGIRAAPLSYSEVTSSDNITYNPSVSGGYYIGGAAWNMFKYVAPQTRSVVIQTTDQDYSNPDTVLRYFGTSKPNDSFSGTAYDNITNGPLQSMVTIDSISGQTYYLAVSNKNNASYNWGIKTYPRDIYQITSTPVAYNPFSMGESISGTGNILRFKYVQPAGSNLINTVQVIDISSNSPVVDLFYYSNLAPTVGISGYTFTSTNKITFNSSAYSNASPVTYYIIAKNRNDENKSWAISGQSFDASERHVDNVSEFTNSTYVPTLSGDIVGNLRYNVFKYIPTKTDYIKFETIDISGTNPDTVMTVSTPYISGYTPDGEIVYYEPPYLTNYLQINIGSNVTYDNISGLVLQAKTDDVIATSGSPIYLSIYSKNKETKPFGVVAISAYPRTFNNITFTPTVYSLSGSGETIKDPSYSNAYSKWLYFSDTSVDTDVFILNISGGGSNIDTFKKFFDKPNNNSIQNSPVYYIEKPYNGSLIKYPFSAMTSGGISYFSIGDAYYPSPQPFYNPINVWKTPVQFIEITTNNITAFNTGISGVQYNNGYPPEYINTPEILFTYSPSANSYLTTIEVADTSVYNTSHKLRYFGTTKPNATTSNNISASYYNSSRISTEFTSGNVYYFSVAALTDSLRWWNIKAINPPNRIFNNIDGNPSTIFTPSISGETVYFPNIIPYNYIFFKHTPSDTVTTVTLVNNITGGSNYLTIYSFKNKKPDYDLKNYDPTDTIIINAGYDPNPTGISVDVNTVTGADYYFAISTDRTVYNEDTEEYDTFQGTPFSISMAPRSIAQLSTGTNFPTPDGPRVFSYTAYQTGFLRVETEGGSANPYTFIKYFGTSKPSSDYSNVITPYCRKESPAFSSRVFVEVISGQQYYFNIDTYNQYQTNLFSIKLEYFDFIDIDNSATSYNALIEGRTFKWWNTNGSPGTTSSGNFLFFKFTHSGFVKQEYLIETIDLDSSAPDTQMYYYGIKKPHCTIATANQIDTNIKNDEYNGTTLSGIRIDGDVSDVSPFSNTITYYFAVKNKDDINCHWGIRATPLNRTFTSITSASDVSYTPDISGEEDFFGNMWLHYVYTNPTSSDIFINIETVDISGVSPDTLIRYYGTSKPSSINIFYNGDDDAYPKNAGYTTFNDNQSITGDNKTPTELTTRILLDAKRYTTHYFSVRNKYGDNKNWGIKYNTELYDTGVITTLTTNASASSYNPYVNGNYLFTNQSNNIPFNNTKFSYFKYVANSNNTVTISIEDIESSNPNPSLFYFDTKLPFTKYPLIINKLGSLLPQITINSISGSTYYFAVKNNTNTYWGIKYNNRSLETIDTSGYKMYNPSISGNREDYYTFYSPPHPLKDEKKLYYVYTADTNNDDVVVQTTVSSSASIADTKLWYLGNTLSLINTEYAYNDDIQTLSPINNLSSLIIQSISGQKYYFAVSNRNDYNYSYGIKYNKRKYLDIGASIVLNPSISGELYNNNNWVFTKYTHNDNAKAMIIETVDVSANTPDTLMYYFGSQKPDNIFSNALSVADDISGVNTLSKIVFDVTPSDKVYFAIANKYNDGKPFGVSIHERNFNVIDISATSMYNPSITGESEGSYKWDFFKLNAPTASTYRVETINTSGTLANTNILFFGTDQPNKLVTDPVTTSSSACQFTGLQETTYYFAISNYDNGNLTWSTQYSIITGGGGDMFTTITGTETGYDSYTYGLVGPSSRKLIWMKFIAPSSGFYEVRTTDIDSASGDTYIYYYGTTEPSDLNAYIDTADDVYGTYAAYTVNASSLGEHHYFAIGNYYPSATERWGVYYS